MTAAHSHCCYARLIVQKLTASTPAAAGRVPAMFVYDPADPFVVKLAWANGRPIVIERAQLAAGLVEPMVTPAVTVMPLLGSWVEITVRVDGRSSLLSFDNGDVRTIVDAAEHLVPAGTELDALDLDAELAALTGGERAA